MAAKPGNDRQGLLRKLIMDAGPRGLTPQEMADAMAAEGFPYESNDPPTAARAAGNRLRQQKDSHIGLAGGHFIYTGAADSLNGTDPLNIFKDGDG